MRFCHPISSRFQFIVAFLPFSCATFAAATATRYESLFILLPLAITVCAVEMHGFWSRRKTLIPVRGLSLLVCAFLPVVIYGLWAISQGGHFLPNSLLLKGNFMPLSQIPHQMFILMGSIAPGCGFLYALSLSLLTAAGAFVVVASIAGVGIGRAPVSYAPLAAYG